MGSCQIRRSKIVVLRAKGDTSFASYCIADAEKLQYLCGAMGEDASRSSTRGRTWAGSAEVRHGGATEPYILVSRGDGFADSFDTCFFAKTFPTLFPLGKGGPRQVEECAMGTKGDDHWVGNADTGPQDLVSS
jgi:hypothetical protein